MQSRMYARSRSSFASTALRRVASLFSSTLSDVLVGGESAQHGGHALGFHFNGVVELGQRGAHILAIFGASLELGVGAGELVERLVHAADSSVETGRAGTARGPVGSDVATCSSKRARATSSAASVM
jgi:hypothetical protein